MGGPHLVAKGHQPFAGARSLAPVGGQTFSYIYIPVWICFVVYIYIYMNICVCVRICECFKIKFKVLQSKLTKKYNCNQLKNPVQSDRTTCRIFRVFGCK